MKEVDKSVDQWIGIGVVIRRGREWSVECTLRPELDRHSVWR